MRRWQQWRRIGSFVDADERGSEALSAEIRQAIAAQSEMGWYVPRHNYIFGKLTLAPAGIPTINCAFSPWARAL